MRQLGYVRYRACPYSQEPDTDAYPSRLPSHACAKPGHFSLGRGENSLDDGIGKIAGAWLGELRVGKRSGKDAARGSRTSSLASLEYMNSIVSKLIKREDGAIGFVDGLGASAAQGTKTDA